MLDFAWLMLFNGYISGLLCSETSIQTLSNAIRLGDVAEVQSSIVSLGRSVLKTRFQFKIKTSLRASADDETADLRLSALHLAILSGQNAVVKCILTKAFSGGDRFIIDLLSSKIKG